MLFIDSVWPVCWYMYWYEFLMYKWLCINRLLYGCVDRRYVLYSGKNVFSDVVLPGGSKEIKVIPSLHLNFVIFCHCKLQYWMRSVLSSITETVYHIWNLMADMETFGDSMSLCCIINSVLTWYFISIMLSYILHSVKYAFHWFCMTGLLIHVLVWVCDV